MSIVFIIYSALALVAMATDIVSYKIPNWLVLALLFLFIAAAVSGMPRDSWQGHLIAGGGTLVVTAAFYALGWMGAGDAKLLAVMALWAGLGGLLALLFYVSLIALGGMLIILVLRHLLPWAAKRNWLRLPQPMPRVLIRGEGVPYAIGIGPGAILAAVFWFPTWLWLV